MTFRSNIEFGLQPMKLYSLHFVSHFQVTSAQYRLFIFHAKLVNNPLTDRQRTNFQTSCPF